MAGRGPQTFKKRQKEQHRREKQQEKLARRLQRKQEPHSFPPIAERTSVDLIQTLPPAEMEIELEEEEALPASHSDNG